MIPTQDEFTQQRQQMVRRQLAERGITDQRVLAAMRSVPRHCFVSSGQRSRAYEDQPLDIGCGQTISQPYIVAYMLQALSLLGDEKALEVGTGSGYQAALLGELCREVHTVERHASLVASATRALTDLGYTNVFVHHGDGSLGWPEGAPYDAEIAAAAAPQAPQLLLDQLSTPGRLVIPVGGPGKQVLQLWARRAGTLDYEELVPVAFVPMIGQQSWV